MSIYTIQDTTLTDIADAIRSKTGKTASMTPAEMVDEIESISGGGVTPTGTKEITANGTNIDVASYAYADVAVPNSYAAGDEGKVVSNGALVSQSSSSATTNGTVNTTLINSLTVAVPASAVDSGTKSITANGSNQDVVGYAAVDVAVPNSYSQSDEGKVVSNGALVAQSSDSVTQNGTVDTTLINSLTVNVSGGTPAISVVDTTDSHGGTIREITALDISDTTAEASDVAQGKYFYTAAGVKTAGAASSGGGTPSATQHTILFEFTDETTQSITGYWDNSFISDAIRATEPTTIGQKTVDSASIDGVKWYIKPSEDWTVLFDGSVTFSSGNPYNSIWFGALGDLQPAVGEVYRVTVDGTVYNLTAHEDDGRIYIGNPLYDWGTDDGSGTPFCFFNGGYGFLQGWTELSATAHTVKLEKQVTT